MINPWFTTSLLLCFYLTLPKKPTSKCYNHNLAEDIKQISQQFHLTDLISPIPFLRSHLARARVTLETFSRSTTCNLSPETDVRKSLAGQKWKKTMCPKWETGTVPKSRGDIVGCSCLETWFRSKIVSIKVFAVFLFLEEKKTFLSYSKVVS